MAETSLGRASLSVTADLSGFTNALDQAAQKTNQLTQTNSVLAGAANTVTTATDKQAKALGELQKAAQDGVMKRLSRESEIAARKMELEVRQTMLKTGATAKLIKELAALEKQEKALAAAEAKLGKGQQGNQPPGPKGNQQGTTSLDFKSMAGIGVMTAGFTKLFDLAEAGFTKMIGWVTSLGKNIITAGAQFESTSVRLKALTGDATLGKGLQDIMKAGPSASFEALADQATRLAALKFHPESIKELVKSFNSLGVALGNPERIMNLITDKIADMAAEGVATMPALSKLAEEGIPVWDALAMRLSQATGRMVSVAEAQQMVANGMVSVSDATGAIADASKLPGMQAAATEASNTFTGLWQTATNNVLALFQQVGSSLMEGFALTNLSEGIQTFFDLVSEKIEAMQPMLMGIGSFFSAVVDIILAGLSDFLEGWSVATGEMTIDEIVLAAREAALDFIQAIYDFGKGIFDFFKPVSELFSGIMFLINALTTGMKSVWDFLTKVVAKAVEWVVWVLEKIGLVSKGTTAEMKRAQEEAKRLEKQRNEQPATGADKFFEDQRKKLDELKLNKLESDPQGRPGKNNLTNELDGAGKAADKLKPKIDGIGQSTKKAVDEAKKLNENLQPTNVIRKEEPPWKKFLADNLSPLQVYQNEIAKLNLMLDGTAEGEMAFAMGSSNALAKLKSATGLGQGPKFASAITAGSAEDFQADLERMGKNVDVQQQIRELMEEAKRIQEAQLAAQKEIAAAIKAQPKPPKPVNQIAAGV